MSEYARIGMEEREQMIEDANPAINHPRGVSISKVFLGAKSSVRRALNLRTSSLHNRSGRSCGRLPLPVFFKASAQFHWYRQHM
ncbi:hypothetical protein TRAPUB_11972 [Trametes pubescens]|uniref:Uncharacterized protein n=1 Tax=Trametes pubescens TaxID=154538 RepID=A0A1M2VVG6_TRAPU|nr:hypothetical protein TRAPUB_11972 [Trametes pubescens]